MQMHHFNICFNSALTVLTPPKLLLRRLRHLCYVTLGANPVMVHAICLVIIMQMRSVAGRSLFVCRPPSLPFTAQHQVKTVLLSKQELNQVWAFWMCADTCFAVSHCTAFFCFFLLHFVLLFFFSHQIESSMKSLCLGLVECFLWLFSFQVTGMLLCKGICQSLHIVYFIHGHIPVIKCDITVNHLIQFRKVANFSGELS